MTTIRKTAFSGQDYFPPGLERRAFFRANDRGFERELGKRLGALGRAAKRLETRS